MALIKCNICGNQTNDELETCVYCNAKINKERKKTTKKIKFFVLAVVLIIAIIVGYIIIKDNITKQKYAEAISYYEQQEYDKALEIFNHKYLYDYELSVDYRGAIYMIGLLNEEKYDEALQCDISDAIPNAYRLKTFAKNGSNYKAQNYQAIWEDNKYTTDFYNDKEKEIVYDGIYNYGLSLYNDGYYGTTKAIFEKIIGYKNCAEILNDKYFQLIGHYYSYVTSYGYTYGSVSFLFYENGNTMNYNVFTQSLFNTNIPKGYEYSYKIKNNQLLIGDYIVYDIVSFNGNTLVVRQGSSRFTLTKEF